MKRRQTVSTVQLVPIDKISVITPSKRNRKVFRRHRAEHLPARSQKAHTAVLGSQA
jgi:hypothetical protein